MQRLKQIVLGGYRVIIYPVKDNPVFFLFTFLMNEEMLFVGHYFAQGTNWFLGTLLPLFDGYLFCVAASLLKKVYLRWIAWTAYVVILLGEVFSMVCYHSEYSIRVLQLVMQTTGQESAEFIGDTFQTPAPWLAFGFVLGCWLVAWGLHWIYNRYTPEVGKGIWRVIVFAMVVWSGMREIPQYICIGRSFSEETTTMLGDYQHLPRLSGSCCRFFYSIAFNYVSAKELDYLVTTVEHTQVQACEHTCPTIVLIIGESFSKYHTPLYVPHYEQVSPRLCALRDKGQVKLMRDAVSCSNLTSVVLKNMFSTHNDDSPLSDIHHTLFPAVFRQAGYKVYFLSNQFCIGEDDIWSLVGGTIFNHPELSRLQFDYRNRQLYPYDGGLLEEVPPVDSITKQPALVLFHVMGQHVNYNMRYPESQAVFTADDTHPNYGGQRAKEITATYDNATLYNDSVVAALWQRFEKEDAVGIYLSDHGEEMFDWRNYSERSDMNRMNQNVARYQLEIPMMFLMTDTFQMRHPELKEAIEHCLDRPFIHNNLFHTLFHLAGIQHEDYRSSRDLLSPNYDNTLPRIIGNGVDYDELMHTN